VNAPRAVGVVIPANDEEAGIAATVDSVLESLERADVDDVCIVVVADSCHDRTAAIARRRLAPPHVVVEVAHRSVGATRATGSLLALARLSAPPEGCWLLSIDGDSIAPPDWVTRHLLHAARGIECVTGIVELAAGAPMALRRAFAESYLVAVDGSRHAHVHGTNFGIRGDTLLAAGNWSTLRTGEDHELWRAVAALGRPARQDPTIVVATSPRTVGRAPDGFAADLAELTAAPIVPVAPVEPPVPAG